jgi:hydroxymethylbilane synthase
MRSKIVVGSRRSKLALIQTESVVARIEEMYPHLEVYIEKIATTGDRDRSTQLDRIGVAVFVKELEEALLRKQIDLAVHSLKDMPTEIPEGLCIAAVTERLDPKDALVAGSRLDDLAPGSRIGTGSLRRSAQLLRYRPGLDICPIRGNVDTRLRKLADGEFDGVVVAAAALLRLGLQDRITEYLPLEHFLPAAGQGALAVEARQDDREILDLVSPLDHLPSRQSTTAERAFLRALGGGCRTPVGVLGQVYNTHLKLEAMVAGATKDEILYASDEGDPAYPEETGMRLARKMLEMGASQYIAEVRNR